MKSTITIDYDDGSCEEFTKHPIYKHYAANKQGNVINLKTNKLIGHKLNTGYIQLGLYVPNRIHMYCHRFVFECYNGIITDDSLVVKHLDNYKSHNNIDNLALDTQSNNTKDAFRDKLIKGGQKPRKPCVGIDSKGTEHSFKSFMDAERQSGCNHRRVLDCCIGTIKSTTSKTDGTKWTFKYPD